jgi:hypothetical protein
MRLVVWTPSETAKLRELYPLDIPLQEICILIGRSPSACEGQAKRIGVRRTYRSDWTEEKVQLLRELWDEGLSMGQIAARIPGMSRCSIAGKIHRLGDMAKRPASSTFNKQNYQREYRARRRATIPARALSSSRARAVGAVASLHELPPPLNLSLIELERHQCHNPRGENGSYCGHPVFEKQSYCPPCYAVLTRDK